jgi:hypothetical protein
MRIKATLAFVLILANTAISWADGFCAQLDDLMAAAFDVSAVVTFDLGDTMDRPANCTHSRGLEGALSLHCAQAFEYRSADATIAFDSLLGQVSLCAAAIDRDDQSVSHPDSYDLRQFQLDTGTVSVSLKDKASLAQTYLFLRVSQQGAS